MNPFGRMKLMIYYLLVHGLLMTNLASADFFDLSPGPYFSKSANGVFERGSISGKAADCRVDIEGPLPGIEPPTLTITIEFYDSHPENSDYVEVSFPMSELPLQDGMVHERSTPGGSDYKVIYEDGTLIQYDSQELDTSEYSASGSGETKIKIDRNLNNLQTLSTEGKGSGCGPYGCIDTEFDVKCWF